MLPTKDWILSTSMSNPTNQSTTPLSPKNCSRRSQRYLFFAAERRNAKTWTKIDKILLSLQLRKEIGCGGNMLTYLSFISSPFHFYFTITRGNQFTKNCQRAISEVNLNTPFLPCSVFLDSKINTWTLAFVFLGHVNRMIVRSRLIFTRTMSSMDVGRGDLEIISYDVGEELSA